MLLISVNHESSNNSTLKQGKKINLGSLIREGWLSPPTLYLVLFIFKQEEIIGIEVLFFVYFLSLKKLPFYNK